MLSRRELIAGGAGIHLARGDAAAAQNERELKELRQEVGEIRSILTANPVATSGFPNASTSASASGSRCRTGTFEICGR